MFKWIKFVSPGDYFTAGNGVFGIISMLIAIITGNFVLASLMLLIAMIFDKLDGTIARRFGSKHNKGHIVDSVSDTISFCIAPAVILYFSFNNTDNIIEFISVLGASIMFAWFGVWRLVRFSKWGFKEENFFGVATPIATLFLISTLLLFGVDSVYGEWWFISIPLAFIISVMMIANLEYPKASDKDIIFIIIGMSLFITTFVVALWSRGLIISILATLIFMLTSAYVFGGSFVVKMKKERENDARKSDKK